MRNNIQFIHKIFILILITTGLFAQSEGDLDTNFGTNGIVSIDVGDRIGEYANIGLQTNDTIIVAANWSFNGGYSKVYKLLNNGTVVSSFGNNNGYVQLTWGSTSSGKRSMEIQDNNKIVFANGTVHRFELQRLHTNGDSDSFVGSTSLSEGYESSEHAIGLNSDGQVILAANMYLISNETSPAVSLTYNTDGSLNSYYIFNSSWTMKVYNMAVQSDGKFLTVGRIDDSSSNGAFLGRYNADGTFDTSFSSDGYLIGNSGYAYNDIIIQSDGKILVTAGDGGIHRYNSDGTVDSSFNNSWNSSNYGEAKNVSLQSDGKIVTLGMIGYNTAISRFNTDGAIDNSFSGDGTIILSDFSNRSWGIKSLAIQSDDNILVVGTYEDPGGAGPAYKYLKVARIHALLPTISSVSLASDNSTIAVTMSEAVYNATGGSGALETSDFVFTISGGSATLSSATPSSISISGNVYTLGISISGTPDGSEVLTVVPASSTAIYDAAGNAASTTQSNNTATLNDQTAPTTPTGLVATPGNAQVVLTWTANTESDLASYKVYGGTTASPTTLLSTVIGTIVTYTHTSLTNGTTYYYRISAVDNAGNESEKTDDVYTTPWISGGNNVSGVISGNQVWTANGSPYTVTGDVGVSAGYTLTIEAGVTVNYSGDYKLLVKGNILVNGSSLSHVILNGNSSTGSEVMILFKETDLSNSSINYTDYSGPQYAIQLAEESEHNQDQIKNSDTLKVHYSSFNNTGVFTDGYSTTAGLIINNSTFSSCTIKGYYPRTEPIIINNCTIDNSTISSDSYNYGITIKNTTVKNSTITMGCCSANFDFQNSVVYNTPSSEGGGSPVNGDFKIVNSKFVDSPVSLGSAKLTITNSVISDNSSDVIYLGNGPIENSSFIGVNSNNGIKISGRAGYNIGGSTSISGSLLYGFTKALVFEGVNTVTISNNNLLSISQYAVENSSSSGFSATNNYWGTTNSTEIENLIYHGNDDLDYGTVTFSPYLSSYNTDAPISPPTNVVKQPSGGNIVLTWDANPESDVAGYKIHFGNFTGYSYATSIDAGNITTYTLTGVSIDSSISVTAYDGNIDGTDDQVEGYQSWFALAEVAPEPPTNLAIDAAPTKTKLTWTVSTTSDVSSYKIYRGTSANPTTEIASVSSTTTSYTDQTLTNGTTYYYRMTAVKSSGLTSSYTSDVSAKPMPTWHISTSGSSSGFGSSSSPLASIQAGIDSSSTSDTVLVHPGTYTENINYNGKNIVVGSLYLTTSDTSYISSTIIDGNQAGSVVTFDGGENTSAILIGFTIQNGKTSSNSPNGAGIYLGNADALLKNLIVKDNIASAAPAYNTATNGGGIYISSGSNGSLIESEIKNNTTSSDYYGKGSGLFINSNNFTVQNCSIHSNSGTYYGGGISVSGSSTIENCEIYNNSSTNSGGGISVNGGSPTLKSLKVYSNSAGFGGGIYFSMSIDNTSLMNSLVFGNSEGYGSELSSDRSYNGINVINSTIVGASGTTIWVRKQANYSISNSIVIGTIEMTNNLSIVDVSYSLIEGGESSVSNSGGTLTWGTGNIDSDPFFVDATNGDYRLSDYSPAIGAGTATGAPTTDIEGNIRPNPVGSTPDMGAYENALGTPVEHILVTNDSLVVLEDSSSTIDLLDNDLILNITSFTLVIVDSADNGTIALVGDSAMSYSPNANFFGNDTLSYRVFSSEATDTGLVFITVTPVNDPPEIVIPMNDMVVDEDNEPFLLGSLDFNDIDSDLTYSFTNDNTNLLSVNIEENNNVMLTLFADSSGTANLTFTADDGEYTVTDSVVVTINPVNDPPVANAFADTTDEDNSVNFELTGSDIEEVALTFVILDSTVHGTLAGVLPSLTYTPEAHYFGADSFTFIVNDGEYLDTAQVSLTVQAINDIPVANAQNTNTDEDTPIEIVLSGSDIENSDLVFSIVDSTVNGVLTGTLPELTYTPNENFNGSDSLTFIANDGELNSEPATVSITVNPVNDAPGIFLPDAFEFNEDDLLTVDFTPYFNDIDSDSSLILTVSDNVHIGVDIDTFLVTFTADTNWNGFEDIVFTIDDQNLRFTDSDTVRVTLLPVNDAPIITALDSVNIDEDSYAEVNLVGSDVDGDSLTFVATSTDTSVITIVSNDTLTLTPAVNWNGTADITVFVSDGFLSDTTSFVLTVTPVNDAPGITLPDTTINEGGVIEIILLADDIDGDELTYSSSSDTNAVIINVNEDTLLVSLIENWNGSSVITVVVTDENATSDTAEFILTVNPVNDSPEEFSVIYPTVSDTFSTHADNDSLIQFIWGKSNDVDSEVNYTLTIELEFFGNVYTDFYDDISDTTISISSNSLDPLLNVTAQDEAVFTFYVQASDEEYTVSDTGEFILSREALGIDDEVGIPEVFALHQNYPNPFNPTTTLRYDLPEQAHVEIMIYDIMGREVRSLVNNQQNAGFKSVLWDATNESGQPVSAGMYIYRISAGDFHSVKKMILLK